MKKRLIPATIAALAISLTSVVAPSANAAAVAETIVSGESTVISTEAFADFAGDEEAAEIVLDNISEVEFFQDDAPVTWVSYNAETRTLSIADGTKAGTYTLNAEATTTIGTTDTVYEGTVTFTVEGTELERPAEGDEVAVTLDGGQQTTGLSVSNKSADTTVSATDEDGTPVPAGFINTTEIYVNPTEGIDGPLTITVDDPSLEEPLTATVEIAGHSDGVDDNDSDVELSGTPKTVQPANTSQPTGITITNRSEATSITATDEDRAPLSVTVDDEGGIFVTPGADVDGPITLNVTHPTIVGEEDGNVSFTIPVQGHEEDADDNDSEVPDETEDPEENDGSSLPGSSDDDNSAGGAIGIAIAAVIAAIAAFLGAVGAGIIQLPPAIANLLPF